MFTFQSASRSLAIKQREILAALAFLASAGLGLAQSASFQGLGGLTAGSTQSQARSLSENGAVIVGGSASGNGDEAFRWDAANWMVGLGDLVGGSFTSTAYGVSGDGSTVVGMGTSGTMAVACRWDLNGLTELPKLASFDRYSRADSISRDGTVIGGVSSSNPTGGDRNIATIWTTAGAIALEGDEESAVSAINADGSIPVGRTRIGGTQDQACSWHGGHLTILDRFAGGSATPAAGALAVSADGRIIVGYSPDASGTQVACRWIGEGAPQALGDLPGGTTASDAFGTSDDGMIIVGHGNVSSGQPGGRTAFIWDPMNQMRDLREVLTAAGANVSGWYLYTANAVSPDGTIVCGAGRNPSGQTEAWVAHLPRPCFEDLTGDHNVDLVDVAILLSHFGLTIATHAEGDVDFDGDVDLGDLAMILAAYGKVCN